MSTALFSLTQSSMCSRTFAGNTRRSTLSALGCEAEGFSYVLLHRQGLDYMLRTGYDPLTVSDTEMLVTLQHRWQLVYGTTPLQIVAGEAGSYVVGADSEPYALYDIRRHRRCTNDGGLARRRKESG